MIEFFFDVHYKQINGKRNHREYIKGTAELSRFIAYCEDNSEKVIEIGYNLQADKKGKIIATVRQLIDISEYLAYDGKKQQYVAKFEVKLFEKMQREHPEIKF